MLHRLRARFSSSYRIRQGYGLEVLRNERETRALIEFCKEQLKDKDYMSLNPAVKELFEATIKLYEWEQDESRYEIKKRKDGSIYITGIKYVKFKHLDGGNNYRKGYGYSSFTDLVEDYIGWYWT